MSPLPLIVGLFVISALDLPLTSSTQGKPPPHCAVNPPNLPACLPRVQYFISKGISSFFKKKEQLCSTVPKLARHFNEPETLREYSSCNDPLRSCESVLSSRPRGRRKFNSTAIRNETISCGPRLSGCLDCSFVATSVVRLSQIPDPRRDETAAFTS
jgi:hypothetical protein